MSLTGQHVVVLGGTSGIGFAVAAAAAGRAAKVTVVSSDPERVAHAVAQLPDGVAGKVADLTEPARVTALFDEIGALDHLVFTAGEALLLGPLADLDLTAARKFFELRYFGVLAAVRAAAPLIAPGGSITLTTGTASPRPIPGSTVTSSVCGALEGLTRALAVELAPTRVNAVMPGVVRSPMWDFLPEDAREQLYGSGGGAPLGRIGETTDIAEAYLFYLTQRHATGTIMPLDGGAILV
ncbi:SDR family oxidoreductase [Nocardia arthritidis]|uniref:SDR family oxidoreductase n=1 Tax=Nocardia arthritidis TaxID=228602 RepID=A0A6G9YD57_9NOCA|nr:SDR family oxidoreductase [Nocardia arthritidis]QIS11104.1 SDR family oxidoreductase [Nocardia arthritidis]